MSDFTAKDRSDVRLPLCPWEPIECVEEGTPYELIAYAHQSLLLPRPSYRFDLIYKATQQFNQEPHSERERQVFRNIAAAVHGYLWSLWMREIESISSASEFVYFVKDGTRVKIGLSNDPKSRMKTFRVGNSRNLQMLKVIKGDKSTETALHSKFASTRIAGEWFHATPGLLEYIDSLTGVDY